MEWNNLNSELKRYHQTTTTHKIDIQTLIDQSNYISSFSSQINALNTYEKRKEYHIEVHTSGESSPCKSESGKKARIVRPSIFDLNKLDIEEDYSDIDYDIEGIDESSGYDLNIVIEGLEKSFSEEQFVEIMNDVKLSSLPYQSIFTVKNIKFVNIRGKKCLLLWIEMLRVKLFPRYMRKLQMKIKNVVGYAVRISKAAKSKNFNGVFLRNLPPKLTTEEISKQFMTELDGNIDVSSISNIKDRNCCFIKCDFLEDAEVICKKIHKVHIRDTKSQENYVIKVSSK